MDYLAIENGIVTVLDTAIDAYEVLAWPGEPDEWQFIHDAGAVLVRFNGVRFADPDVENIINQEVIVEYVINLMLRDLRDNDGMYTMISKVSNALIGHTATIGCDTNRTIFPIDISYVDFNRGVWHYAMTFGFTGHEMYDT